MAQMVKNLPAVQETRVQSMGGEDPLEKGMVTHSSILSWRIPRTEEPGGLQSIGLQRVRRTKNLAGSIDVQGVGRRAILRFMLHGSSEGPLWHLVAVTRTDKYDIHQ